MKKFFKPFEAPVPPTFNDLTVDIRDFGAVEGGIEKVTDAIKKAIEYVNENGGGRVVIPEGKWYTGPIHFKSNIDLHFAEGSYVEFSTDFEDYLPVVRSTIEGIRCYTFSHLLYADTCENIAVTGSGVLNGNGQNWWYMKFACPGMVDLIKAGKEHRPLEQRVYDKLEDGVRPRFVEFLNCKNVLVEGITFINSPSWTVLPLWCENIILRKITIRNPEISPNTDGLNFECCKRGLIEYCDISGGDDMICIKAGRDEDAWEVGIPSEDIEIRYCTTRWAKGSGITIGSEMSAGVKNAYIHDLDLGRVCCGINIKSMRGRGGYVENIDYENIKIDKCPRSVVKISMFYTGGDCVDSMNTELINMPTLKNISVENVTCNKATTGITVEGYIDHEVENVYLKDITANAETPTVIKYVKNLNFENVSINLCDEEPYFKSFKGVDFNEVKDDIKIIYDYENKRIIEDDRRKNI
ncbi:MAG: glycoside hydrolase family 28 protein [Ruminococcaceae bacterium]|nr:glycoside hydrolase family 28 protein [Oscillospiraceae bacterium]